MPLTGKHNNLIFLNIPVYNPFNSLSKALINNFNLTGVTESTADITNQTTVMTDVFIFLDTSWEYNHVVDYVNYVVERLNVNPYGSSITLLSARDGNIIVNRTFYIADIYANWNTTAHSSFRTGFSLPIILSKARDLAEEILNTEREQGSLGGRSLIAMLVPSPIAFVHEYDFDYCQHFMQRLNVSMPDLKFIFYAGGAAIRFTDYVSNPSEDVFPLDYDIPIDTCAEPVVKRIRRVPRRLINPRCSPKWTSESQGLNALKEYEGLGKLHFYRMSPQYFYHEGSMRYLKVKPISSVAFVVCTSRTIDLPYRNPTSPFTAGQDCKQISSSEFSYDLTDMCRDTNLLMDCPPLYVSVQAQGFAEVSQVLCTDEECPTPLSAQYSIYVNNLDCTNSGRKTVLDLSINIMTLIVLSKWK